MMFDLMNAEQLLDSVMDADLEHMDGTPMTRVEIGLELMRNIAREIDAPVVLWSPGDFMPNDIYYLTPAERIAIRDEAYSLARRSSLLNTDDSDDVINELIHNAAEDLGIEMEEV